MVLDDDEILQLKDTLGDAYEKAEGIRQLLFALHISDNIDDIILTLAAKKVGLLAMNW